MPNAVLPPPFPACGTVHGGLGSTVRASQRPCHGVRVDVEVGVVVFGLARLTSVSMLQEAGVRVLERVAALPNMLEKSQGRESVMPDCPTRMRPPIVKRQTTPRSGLLLFSAGLVLA